MPYDAPLKLQRVESRCPLLSCQLPINVVFSAATEPQSLLGPPVTPLIGGHATLLAEQSEGAFPRPEDVTPPGRAPVKLSENADVIRLLFAFMHSKIIGRQPIELLRSCKPNDIIALAVAAEKYVVPNVVELCRLAMETRVREMPVKVFAYAAQHGDQHLANEAAPFTMACSHIMNGDMRLVPHNALVKWYHMRDGYIALAEAILGVPDVHINNRGKRHNCGEWGPYQTVILNGLPSTTMSLVRHLALKDCKEVVEGRWDSIVHAEMLDSCKICRERSIEWENKVKVAINCLGRYDGTAMYAPKSQELVYA